MLEVDKPGTYEVAVFAYDPASGNTGVDKLYRHGVMAADVRRRTPSHAPGRCAMN